MNNTPKGGSCWQLIFASTDFYPADFSNFIEDYFSTSSLDYTDDGAEQISAYADMSFDEAAFKEEAALRGITIPAYEKKLLESSNWLKDYVIEFAPVEIADFLIYGIHEHTAPKTDKIPLQIYAATAFGSEHPTTRCCIEALCDLYHQGFQPKRILDMGTGSGILALAAAKLWPKGCKITAVDIDNEAVIVTMQNAATNHIEHNLSVAQSVGYDSKLVHSHAPYDLVFSNILARPLIDMAPQLYQSLHEGGVCILSGFVAEQEDWVITAHQQQGLKLKQLYKIDDWRAAVMEK